MPAEPVRPMKAKVDRVYKERYLSEGDPTGQLVAVQALPHKHSPIVGFFHWSHYGYYRAWLAFKPHKHGQGRGQGREYGREQKHFAADSVRYFVEAQDAVNWLRGTHHG